jgi:hypothetical protein
VRLQVLYHWNWLGGSISVMEGIRSIHLRKGGIIIGESESLSSESLATRERQREARGYSLSGVLLIVDGTCCEARGTIRDDQ